MGIKMILNYFRIINIFEYYLELYIFMCIGDILYVEYRCNNLNFSINVNMFIFFFKN